MAERKGGEVMEIIPGHDRWLDPPEYPTRGYCAGCQDYFDYDDMTVRMVTGKDDLWYCHECMDDLLDEIIDEDDE